MIGYIIFLCSLFHFVPQDKETFTYWENEGGSLVVYDLKSSGRFNQNGIRNVGNWKKSDNTIMLIYKNRTKTYEIITLTHFVVLAPLQESKGETLSLKLKSFDDQHCDQIEEIRNIDTMTSNHKIILRNPNEHPRFQCFLGYVKDTQVLARPIAVRQ